MCSCKWTQLPDDVKKSMSLNKEEPFDKGPLSYHRHTRMHERTQTQRLSLHSWLNMLMSESFNERSNNRERLSIWGGSKERNVLRLTHFINFLSSLSDFLFIPVYYICTNWYVTSTACIFARHKWKPMTTKYIRIFKRTYLKCVHEKI